jgi:hypothetical protein
MAGCFGNHPVDRWMERQLDDYLNSFDPEDERPVNDNEEEIIPYEPEDEYEPYSEMPDSEADRPEPETEIPF